MPDFLEDLLGHCGLELRQFQGVEEPGRFGDGEARYLGDTLAGDNDITGFLPQSLTPARETGRISAVAADKDADVHLVFLQLQIFEKPEHAGEIAFPLYDPVSFPLLELRPGHMNVDRRFLRKPQQPLLKTLVP